MIDATTKPSSREYAINQYLMDNSTSQTRDYFINLNGIEYNKYITNQNNSIPFVKRIIKRLFGIIQ